MTHQSFSAEASSKVFSRSQWVSSDGSCVQVAFTSVGAGNLGVHVGDDEQAVLASRSALQQALVPEVDSTGFVYLNQVHGTAVFDADGFSGSARVPTADAASSSDGTPLAIMVADCIPVVFAGEEVGSGRPVQGVAHAGRRGLLDGVLQAEVTDLLARGARNIQAWIGPSICGSCYEVPEAMRRESAQLIPEVYATTAWGTPALDLPAGARAVLAQLPVTVHTDLAACTFEEQDLFSHRGHTQRGEPAGRLAGLVWVDSASTKECTE